MASARRRVCLLVAVVVMAGLFAPAASASVAAPPTDLSIASARGGWVGRGSFDQDPVPRALLATTIAPGKVHWAYLDLHNTGGVAHTYVLTGAPSGPRFAITYLDDRGADITAAVTGAGEQVSIPAHRTRLFEMEVQAVTGLDTGASATFRVRAGVAPQGPRDMVRLRVTVPPLTVWSTSFNGRFRCTATYPHRILTAGRVTGVRVKITNLTSHPIRSVPGDALLSFRSADGTFLDRTGLPGLFFGPPPIVRTLKPHGSARLFTFDTKVRWSGPLSVQVICGDLRLAMPRVPLDVTSPGAPATIHAAIDAAVSLPASPFQQCHPGPAGQPATGVLPAPGSSTLPAMTVRCWATVSVRSGFDVVVLHLVSPSNAPAYVVDERLQLHPAPPRRGPNYEAVTWAFVVTSQGATPYLSDLADQALGTGRSAEFELAHGTWRSSDQGPCGYWSYTWDGNGDELPVDWIAGCHQSAGAASRVAPRRGPARRVQADPDRWVQNPLMPLGVPSPVGPS